jgi:hypothetical protein
MEAMATIQELWRRRIFVAVALLASAAAFLEIAYQIQPGLPPTLKSRQYDVGVATARVLVDTPSSIVADLNPNGGASLSIHSQLLADLIASESVRAAIAQSAGLPEQDLVVRPPSITAPGQTPVVRTVTAPEGASTVSLAADQTLPIVAVNAQAPTVAQAARLANATVTALRSYLLSVDISQRIPPSHRVVITALGTAQAATATQGRSPLIGLGASIVLFMLLCYLVVFVSGIRRRLAATQTEEGRPSDDAPEALAPPGTPQARPPESAPAFASADAPAQAAEQSGSVVTSEPPASATASDGAHNGSADADTNPQREVRGENRRFGWIRSRDPGPVAVSPERARSDRSSPSSSAPSS